MSRTVIALVAAVLLSQPACAQRHSYGTAPPTAPPPHLMLPAVPVAPVSSGLGALQFIAVNYGVPPPQALTRQLRSDDEHTRAAALSAIGAPGQYLQHGHTPLPHTIDVKLASLGSSDELDAILTVELDEHIVSAILVPEDTNWRRVATVVFPTTFDDPRTTPDTFLHLERSFLAHDRYRAIFRADTAGPEGDFVENEAEIRILNDRAIIVMSFASASRECAANAAPGSAPRLNPGSSSVAASPAAAARKPDPASPGSCSVMRRWFVQDTSDPARRFFLVTGSGRLIPRDLPDEISLSRIYENAHLHSFTCQPFIFSDTALRFEPVAPNGSCRTTPTPPVK